MSLIEISFTTTLGCVQATGWIWTSLRLSGWLVEERYARENRIWTSYVRGDCLPL